MITTRLSEDGPPLTADDADVGAIAAHTARMAIDVLVRGDTSNFPHPAYVIGLATDWVFAEPFDTRPIDFSAEGEWQLPRFGRTGRHCGGILGFAAE